MTLAEAWDILDAADHLARLHGCECRALVTTWRTLQIRLWRGAKLIATIELTEQRLNDAATPPAVRELVEREIAAALTDRGAMA